MRIAYKIIAYNKTKYYTVLTKLCRMHNLNYRRIQNRLKRQNYYCFLNSEFNIIEIERITIN